MRQIYLDFNATTPVPPSVVEAMHPFFGEHYGNPSSSHAFGRAATEAIEDARMQVAALLGADQEEVIFTSGGTESNNLAIKGAMMAHGATAGGHIVISAIEHPAVSQPARFLERMGFDLTIVGCDQNGVVKPEMIEQALTSQTRLVSVMHANNEIGTIQPIKQISEICRGREILLHTDAAQTIGKVRSMIDELQVDLLTIAGHKVYAPKGVGALYVREGLELEPVLHGAGHEFGLRAGTENTPYIVALGKACLLAMRSVEEVSGRMCSLRDRMADHLGAAIPDMKINGFHANRLPNTLSVVLPGINGNDLLRRCPEICASTGSACHSGTEEVSPTLNAIGLSPDEAKSTLRLSVGWYTSEEEIDRAASLLIDAWENMAT